MVRAAAALEAGASGRSTPRQSARPSSEREESLVGRSVVAPLLEIRDLHKSFGPINVLRGVDLSLDAGEVLALVGDNGAGKSTLIKHISGVYKADSGEIRLDGAPFEVRAPADARRLGIETVYQDLALADDLSVGANIFLGREPARRWFGCLPAIDNRKIRAETAALLGRIESRIPPKAKTVSRLSGGQRQAVAFARALYWQSKVVILDEPTAALAVMEREHVIQLTRRLAAERVGVIYVGHNLIEILEVADRVAVMFQGRIVFVARASATTQQELIKFMTGYSETSQPAPNWGAHQPPGENDDQTDIAGDDGAVRDSERPRLGGEFFQ
jgi:simple sugar transport system ATP-binding protein